MESIEVKERKKRKIDEITEPDKVFALIKAHLASQPLLIKGNVGGETAHIKKIDPKNGLVLFRFSQPVNIQGGQVKLYKVLGRYVEIEGEIVGQKERRDYILRIRTARIATFARKHKRFPVTENIVYMTNIRTSKNIINATQFNIPTTVKVNFRQAEMEARKKPVADIVRIDAFDEAKEEKFDLVRKTGKTLMINDTQSIEAYIPDSDDFVNYQEYLGVDIGDVMRDYAVNKIISEIIVPVNYIDGQGNSVPLGFIQVQSNTEPFDQFKYLELMEMSFAIVDKIRDSNMVSVKVRQPVMDISEGGLKVKITEPELITYLVHQAQFSFDLVFKMQQPLTFSGRICTTYKDKDGNLIIGIQIQGVSSRKGETERYSSYIRDLVIKGE